jgi:hypothetical protein
MLAGVQQQPASLHQSKVAQSWEVLVVAAAADVAVAGLFVVGAQGLQEVIDQELQCCRQEEVAGT